MLIVGAICDRCGDEILFYDHWHKRDIVGALRRKGWTVGKAAPNPSEYVADHQERTLCPRCKRGQKGRENNGTR